MTPDLLITDARLVRLRGPDPCAAIAAQTVAVRGGKITFAGDADGAPAAGAHTQIWPAEGRLLTPGLIDCHTHLVYAGSRAAEFAKRMAGASYAEIAASGGGIMNTVAATRAASEDELIAQSLPRLDRMLAHGVTTVEIKSGYGLDLETELKILRCARRLGELRRVRIITTFLGAHTTPKGAEADAYIDDVCIPALRTAAMQGLVDAVDGFCETIAFTPGQIARVFATAQALGLPVKLHAEQLSNQAGAELAAQFGALSADHLEHVSADGIAAMAAAGTVAVLLPGAFYALRETIKPPVAQLRAAGVSLAVASDSNPGTSPMTSLPLAMNMAAILFGLTTEETLQGVTRNAARALGRHDIGAIAPGLSADLCLWDCTDPAELTYRIGDPPLHARIFEGQAC
jgi:imidazolonepropionase